MKIFITILCLFSLIGCKGQTKGDVAVKEKEMVNQNDKIPKDALQINLGFDDAPALVWVRLEENLIINEKLYSHIKGIKFWDEDGFLHTKYYEQDREAAITEIKDSSSYVINRYPGDKTFQLINKQNDTLYLFSVLENKKFRRTFKGKEYLRIPTVKINTKGQKVSNYDIEINLHKKEDLIYEVSMIDSEGITVNDFTLNCDLNSNFNMSYYDVASGRIYLLEKNCYLEKLDL